MSHHRYRLIDRETETALNALSPVSRFSDALQLALNRSHDDPSDPAVVVNFGAEPAAVQSGVGSFSCLVRRDALVVIDGYDPTGWNDWPAVEPPENVPMAIEYSIGRSTERHRTTWVFLNGRWEWAIDSDCVGMPVDFDRCPYTDVVFKPW